MNYDLELVAADGSVFPYRDDSSSDGYHYRISLDIDGNAAELLIQPHSLHVSLDDDGGWLQFPQTPSELFGDAAALSSEQLLECMAVAAETWDDAEYVSAEQISQLLGMMVGDKAE